VIELKGIPVSPGISIRRAFLLDAQEERITQRFIKPNEVEAELGRFAKALAHAKQELEAEQERTRITLGADIAQIFKFHQLMLEDRSLLDEMRNRIVQSKFTPEYAVSRAFLGKIKMLRSVKSDYIRDRDKDIDDLMKRLLRSLRGEKQEEVKALQEEVVLIAHDLTPAQTAGLDTNKIGGFATDAGGRTSHTAIVARALGIPALVGLGNVTGQVAAGDLVILDGTRGKLIVQPDEATLKDYRAKEKAFIEFQRSLTDLRALPAETLDGHKISLYGNIEFPEEIEDALENGAEGIGLYRTEFLYTNNPEPDEEAHFKAYRQAVELCEGRPLVIRTLDLGADKFSDRTVALEPNPFLGLRSIRLSFQRIDLFKTQLRAILRASAYGPIKLMLPMISSLAEVRKAKLIINDAMDDLEREKVVFDPKIPIGIMVEVPSAALLSDFLAEEVSFLSIGTNDLVQYTLAVDRVNEKVADLYQPAHPAILRLILTVIEAGMKHGVEVSMCGEMSGEVVYTIPLIGLGLRNFSISPASIPEVKKVIRSTTLREAADVAEKIFGFRDAKQTDNYLREKARRIIPQLF
jgi:phosphoenolpyruvate-protein phosphotransferase (PTS system enzyme I)